MVKMMLLVSRRRHLVKRINNPAICTKTGYANPFLMNLEQWHKVNSGSNNSSRVTLRFMADKDIPFSHWEEMVDNGTFLK